MKGVFNKPGERWLLPGRDALVRALRAERIRQGLTQDELAAAMNMYDGRPVSDLECGRTSPTLHTLLRFTTALGMEIQLVPTRQVLPAQQRHPDVQVS